MAGQQENKGTADAQKGTAYRMWPLLCAIITGWGTAIGCSMAWGRATNPRAVLLGLAATAAGALIGIALRRTAGRRTLSLGISLILFAAATAAGKYLSSDTWIVQSKWPVHEIGRTSFAYPSTVFKERKVKDDLLANGSVSIFSNENLKRNVTYMVYDFSGDYPALAGCLESALVGMLAAYKAQFVMWDENAAISDTQIKARFAYTRMGNTYTGIAYAAADGAHYELVMFMPLAKAYSEAFLQRIESEIHTKE